VYTILSEVSNIFPKMFQFFKNNLTRLSSVQLNAEVYSSFVSYQSSYYSYLIKVGLGGLGEDTHVFACNY